MNIKNSKLKFKVATSFYPYKNCIFNIYVSSINTYFYKL